MTPIEKTLIDLYAQFNTPVNQLPYTETLASITASFNTKQSNIFTAGMVWYKLVNMEKFGTLPNLRNASNIRKISTKGSTIRKRVEKLVDLLQSSEVDVDRSCSPADDRRCVELRQQIIDELVGIQSKSQKES